MDSVQIIDDKVIEGSLQSKNPIQGLTPTFQLPNVDELGIVEYFQYQFKGDRLVVIEEDRSEAIIKEFGPETKEYRESLKLLNEFRYVGI